jgi:hypoxanthine phosphoribosyltransferase
LGQFVIAPSNYSVHFSEGEIASRIREIASEISPWIEDGTPGDTIAMPIMTGALFFAADLLRALPPAVRVTPLHYSSYSEVTNLKGDSEFVSHSLPEDISGKRILLIDDIADTGDTLNTLSSLCLERGASEVRSVVAILRNTSTHIVNWSCFRIEHDEWFVGYGMDDKGLYRGLPSLYTIYRKEDD